MSIASLKAGDTAVVVAITARGALRQRLLDVGILPGATVDLVRCSPGGPFWISCQGTRLALRRDEAGSIVVRAIA